MEYKQLQEKLLQELLTAGGVIDLGDPPPFDNVDLISDGMLLMQPSATDMYGKLPVRYGDDRLNLNVVINRRFADLIREEIKHYCAAVAAYPGDIALRNFNIQPAVSKKDPSKINVYLEPGNTTLGDIEVAWLVTAAYEAEFVDFTFGGKRPQYETQTIDIGGRKQLVHKQVEAEQRGVEGKAIIVRYLGNEYPAQVYRVPTTVADLNWDGKDIDYLQWIKKLASPAGLQLYKGMDEEVFATRIGSLQIALEQAAEYMSAEFNEDHYTAVCGDLYKSMLAPTPTITKKRRLSLPT